MLFWLLVFGVLGGGYAAVFTFLPGRSGALVMVLSVILAGYCWTRPRYYLLDQTGGLGVSQPWGGPVVINDATTGRSWTFVLPLVFGDLQNIGKAAGTVIMVCMLGGGLIGLKARQSRALGRPPAEPQGIGARGTS